jgi:putative intracellular protease/amidase
LERSDQENPEYSQTLVKDIETVTATYDVDKISLSDYAAVIMSANYTSVRCRHYTENETKRTTPVVRFFSEAMKNKNIIKGALCHALWILTPVPELLAGRNVICHEVLRADVENAGGIFTTSENGIVVDDDLVTGQTGHHAEIFVETIISEIKKHYNTDVKNQTTTLVPLNITPQKRRILTLVSEKGYWGEELVAPIEVFDSAGYKIDFVTPHGKRPIAIGVSMDADYIDPPLGRPVTSAEMAEKVKYWDNPETDAGQRLASPISLADWFPERPYAAASQYVRLLEKYNRDLDIALKRLDNYDALLIVGGSGPIVDLVNNQRVHDLILAFYRLNKLVAAECYGVACLAFARDWQDAKSIIANKHVTGHCKEYDYHDNTGFMKSRNVFEDFNMGPPPYPLEFVLRDATKPDGAFIGNFGKETSVIVDYPFITGRSTPDSYLTGQKIVECLDGNPPLKRWGW